MTLDDLNTKQEELQAQLIQLEQDKIRAAEQQKADQLDAVAFYEDRANTYRKQAVKAETEADKKSLYQFADDDDEQAYELRRQLGILPQGHQAPVSRVSELQNQLTRQFNSLLVKAVLPFFGYLLADYMAGSDFFTGTILGFIGFTLKSLSYLLFSISAVFGSVWLGGSLLRGLLIGYSLSDLTDDFDEAVPAVRLAILAVLLAAILHFLTSVVPHAN